MCLYAHMLDGVIIRRTEVPFVALSIRECYPKHEQLHYEQSSLPSQTFLILAENTEQKQKQYSDHRD